jgi:hypothetical protein
MMPGFITATVVAATSTAVFDTLDFLFTIFGPFLSTMISSTNNHSGANIVLGHNLRTLVVARTIPAKREREWRKDSLDRTSLRSSSGIKVLWVYNLRRGAIYTLL